MIRRSNLVVRAHDDLGAGHPWVADAVTLDARDVTDGAVTRAAVAALRAGRADVEILVGVDTGHALDALDALTGASSGIVLWGAVDADDVASVSRRLAELETAHAASDRYEIVVVVDCAAAVQHVRELVADARVTQICIDEAALLADLGIPLDVLDLDPGHYARGRVAIEALAANAQPVIWPAVVPDDEALARTALNAHKGLGYKGTLSDDPRWIAASDTAFSPAPAQVAHAEEIRSVFAESVARGSAATRLGGRMIDTPVDDWARELLDLARACRDRDERKRATRR